MNLQPLYDLKERLEYAAIAGTGLLHEDFRLRRAVDALAPLAATSAVFARISTSAKALLETPLSERSARLLDVLSLVDAVAYTQGVTGFSGEILPLQNGGGNYVHAPYSRLQPLIQALSSTGSGRMSLIQAAWKETPEIFSDFRVLPHVVGMLGESYADLADLAMEILRAQSESIVPLLKENFDPAGKRAMVRRIQLIVQLTEAAENEWLVAQLPDAKKEVREAIILALGTSQRNAQLLIDLCSSERGKAKEAALTALAQMDQPDCQTLLRKEVLEKPESHIGCLEYVQSEFTADLCAEVLKPEFEKLLSDSAVIDQQKLRIMSTLLRALYGKDSPAVRELWLYIADALSTANSEKNKPVSLLAGLVQSAMLISILWNPSIEMLSLAREMAKRCKKYFLCCALMADMFEQPADAVYDTYSPILPSVGGLFLVLNQLHWDANASRFCLHSKKANPFTGIEESIVHYIHGIDSRWAGTLIKDFADLPNANPDLFDSVLFHIINPTDPRSCEVIGNYLVDRLLTTANVDLYVPELIRCKWTKWKGIAPTLISMRNASRIYIVRQLIEMMPITNGEKAAELRRCDKIMQKSGNSLWDSDRIQIEITKLEANPQAMST